MQQHTLTPQQLLFAQADVSKLPRHVSVTGMSYRDSPETCKEEQWDEMANKPGQQSRRKAGLPEHLQLRQIYEASEHGIDAIFAQPFFFLTPKEWFCNSCDPF